MDPKSRSRNNTKDEQLSYAEVWDDSLLIDSWNDALKEYKYYHSLHARGEKVEDVLREAEEAEAQQGAYTLSKAEGTSGIGAWQDHAADDVDDGEIEDGEWNEGIEGGNLTGNQQDAPLSDGTQGMKNLPSSASIPHIVLGDGQGRDEGLKNLMIAWYYAGYYTGFYEGQRAEVQNKNEKEDTGTLKDDHRGVDNTND